MCLHNAADSPTSLQSQSFGESASTAGYRAEGSSHESSPASLLFRDQHQFYQNMLVRKIFPKFCCQCSNNYVGAYLDR